MSFWSAIGLADRNATENLVNQIVQLREENQRLISENQRLLLSQMDSCCSSIHQASNQSTHQLTAMISAATSDLSKHMDEITQKLYQQNQTNSKKMLTSMASLSENVSGAKYDIEQAIFEVRSDLLTSNAQRKAQIEEGIHSIQDTQINTHNFLAQSIVEQRDFVKKLHSETETGLDSMLQQIIDHQKILADDSSNAIIHSQEACLSEITKKCHEVLGETRETAKLYGEMSRSEQEILTRAHSLLDEMLALSEQQKLVMDHLSKLRQDSDQFLEIQKSINDIWEIMKAVWVDSLINDFENEIRNT